MSELDLDHPTTPCSSFLSLSAAESWLHPSKFSCHLTTSKSHCLPCSWPAIKNIFSKPNQD